jgi:hypothetical protein
MYRDAERSFCRTVKKCSVDGLELAELCSLWPEFVCSVHAVTHFVCFCRYRENVKLLLGVIKKNTAKVKDNILWLYWACSLWLERGENVCYQNANILQIRVWSEVNVMQSHYRPRQALRVLGGSGSHISRQWAHEGGRVVSPAHRPPLRHRKYSWYSFLLEGESTPGP